MSTFIIRTAARGPEELRAALPMSATTLRCLTDAQGCGEYWCARLEEPVKYRFPAGFNPDRCQREFLGRDAVGEFLWVQIVAVHAIKPDQGLGPGMRGLAVELAYVIDLTLGRDQVLDPAKIEPITEAVINDHTHSAASSIPSIDNTAARADPPVSGSHTWPGSGRGDSARVGGAALFTGPGGGEMGERGGYLVAPAPRVERDRPAPDRPTSARDWRSMMAARPWYRTRRASIAFIVTTAVTIVIGLLLLTGQTAETSHDAPTSVAPEASTSAQPSASRAPTSRPRPPAPPPPAADTRNPVAPPRQYWPRQTGPSQTSEPEIGVTRTPATRSPISVAPKPVTPPKTATPG